MRVAGLARDLIVIGENIHATRVVRRGGERVAMSASGSESLVYTDTAGATRHLAIPEEIKGSRDYREGRVKHVRIAVSAAMAGLEPRAGEGLAYLRSLVERQERSGADFLDLNVDEISLRPAEQAAAMRWLVRAVQAMTALPVAIDSSDIAVIREGLAACDTAAARPLLNSASLERPEPLDLAREHGCPVVITAAGDRGMPQDDQERVANASRMVDAALARGLALGAIYIDALVFPISVDGRFGSHCLQAIRGLRARYGPEVHITGGLSNVSFGLPCRRLVNEVFVVLALESGADSGILDPVTSDLARILAMPRSSRPFELAASMLRGEDPGCKRFLRAYRGGELAG